MCILPFISSIEIFLPTGKFLIPLLEEISNAQNCMNVLGCKIEKVDDFRLEEDEAERLLIRIKKCKGTPKLYPRKAGTPSKNPL